MSYQEALVLQQQFDHREPDLDKLVGFLGALRHEFKHQAVEPKAIEIYFFCLIKGSFYEDLKDQPKLRRYANDVVPVLIEKLADSSKVHDIARKALTDYWRATSLDVERCLRRSGFLNESQKVREETLHFLCALQAAEPKFSPRALLFDIVSTLRDSRLDVRQTCRSCILELYKNSTPQGLAELKLELESQNISSDISLELLKELGVQEDVVAPPEPLVFETAKPVAVAQKRTPLAAVVATPHDTNRIAPGLSLTATTSSDVSPAVEQFLKKIPGTGVEDIKPLYVTSASDLETIMSSLIPAFEGKESEFNWDQRQKNMVTLREIVRGNAFLDYELVFMTSLRSITDGINKSATSLRTTLSVHGCKVIMDLATITRTAIDPFVDGFLQALVKLSASTKKIVAQQANTAIMVLLAYTSFQPRVASLITAACRDKNAQPRLYGSGWLQLTLIVHQTRKNIMESFNCVEAFENSIKGCLTDANPKVREAIRPTYWEFQKIWPSRAAVIMKNLDPAARKALDKLNPTAQPSAAKVAPQRPSFRNFDKSSLLSQS